MCAGVQYIYIIILTVQFKSDNHSLTKSFLKHRKIFQKLFCRQFYCQSKLQQQYNILFYFFTHPHTILLNTELVRVYIIQYHIIHQITVVYL